MSTETHQWLSFQLGDEQYALPVMRILEMVQRGRVQRMPHAPDFIRGIANWRGSAVFALDLRSRLKIKSLHQESKDLVEEMKQREQDHVAWLEELSASLNEDREFKLATDHHKCAFGKWFDSYNPPNSEIKSLLSKFDTPHQKIHSIALEAHKLRRQGEKQSGLDLVAKTWETELSMMKQLFSDLRAVLANGLPEILVVISHKNKPVGILVDRVEQILEFDADQIEQVHAGSITSAQGYIYGMAKIDDTVLSLLSLRKVLEGLDAVDDSPEDYADIAAELPESPAEKEQVSLP